MGLIFKLTKEIVEMPVKVTKDVIETPGKAAKYVAKKGVDSIAQGHANARQAEKAGKELAKAQIESTKIANGADELTKYHDMYEQGILSEKEYKKIKKKLLK